VPIIDVVGIYLSRALGVFDFFIQFSNIVRIYSYTAKSMFAMLQTNPSQKRLDTIE